MRSWLSFRRSLSTRRPEQDTLRRFLIHKYTATYGQCMCSMCQTKLPPQLLDVSHIKPRRELAPREYLNKHNVELMCKMCHRLFDIGQVAVAETSEIVIKPEMAGYDGLSISQMCGSPYIAFNKYNEHYLNWHYRNIFGGGGGGGC